MIFIDQSSTRRLLLANAAKGALLVSTGGLALPTNMAFAATTLRLAIPDPMQSSVGSAAKLFADMVKDKTGGAVVFEIFPDGVLFGKDQNAAVNQLGSGALDGLILASSVYASFEPRMNAISLPYLFSNYAQLQSYLREKPGQTLLASLDRLSIKGLGIFLRTFRDVTTRDTPITKAGDFKGIKLRTPNNDLFVSLFQALGANPTPMAFSEVYNALQLKVIDGQENPVEVPYNNRFYEVQKDLNITQHVADSFLLALSGTAWKKIPEQHRSAVEQAASAMVKQHDSDEIAQEEKIIKELQSKGMRINNFADGELAKVQKIAQGIYPKFEAKIGTDFMKMSADFISKA